MNYSKLSPVWIINTLSEEECKQFEERISQQLLAYSLNEIGTSFDSAQQRWWKIDRVSEFDVALIDGNKHPQDIPAYSLTKNKLDESYLLVIVVGNLSNFNSSSKIIQDLKRLKENALFMLGGGVRINYYGLFYFEKGQNVNIQLENSIKVSGFDTVFLQGTNNNAKDNTKGYHILKKDEESNNLWDLSVQIVHHLILTKDNLNYFNDSKLHIVGATSLVFEPKGEKRLKANIITQDIIKKFKTENNGTHWHDKKKATISDSFKEFHGWKNIYNELRGGYDNLSTENLHIPSKVSPWSLFLKVLIKEYFRKYIKSVVRLIHENVTSFCFVTIERYKNHLANKYSGLASDNKNIKAIEDELCSVWDKKRNEEKNCAIGLQQFKSKLEELTNFFDTQKESIEKLKSQTAPEAKRSSFPEIYDFPLGNFGDKYQKRHDDYLGKGDDGKSGDSILQRLTRILQFHPVPLSLLVRSILLGVLLPMCVLTILKLVPDYILNTAAIETQPGSIYLVVGCFILCILVAFVQYLFLVVDNIRVKIRDYISWSLYKLQLQAYTITLDKTSEYFESCIAACNAIKKRCDNLITAKEEIKISDYSKFRYNSFQLNVMGDYEGYKILRDGSMDYRYNVWTPTGKETVSVANRTDDVHFKVFREALIFSDNEALNVLKQYLFDFKTTENPLIFDIALRNAIEKDLAVFVHNTAISTLSDMLFDTGIDRSNGKNNMATHADNGYKDTAAKYIKVQSYPSGEVVGAYHYISYVIPISNLYNERLWDNLFSWAHRLSNSSGSYFINILQGFAVSELKYIKDLNVFDNNQSTTNGDDAKENLNNKEM